MAIGLTTDAMLYNKPQRDLIQPFSERKEALEEFVRAECDASRCSIFPIDTMEGGADKMEDLEALIISDEISVVQNTFAINQLRIEHGLKRFHIIIIPMVQTPDGRPLSSTRIRAGEEIDPKTLIY